MVCLASSSGACVLTQDLPDPALDVPTQYKYAGKADAPPTLDWWRGFRSSELTQLMEEAQTVNLDIAAAVSRIVEADAQARQAGAALLPSLSGGGSETYSRTSGSSASGLTNGGREVVNYSSSLSASYQLDFWGQNRDALQTAEETANANRFDRDVVVKQPQTGRRFDFAADRHLADRGRTENDDEVFVGANALRIPSDTGRVPGSGECRVRARPSRRRAPA